MLAAASGSGKSYWVKRLLENVDSMINPPPKFILWCYSHYQPIYDELKKNVGNIHFVKGLPEDVNDRFDTSQNTLVILDDLMTEAGNDVRVLDLFTRGSHHLNLSVIFISQNLFHQGKQIRTMSLNCHYFVLFKNARDKSQIHHLARQMFPGNPRYLQESFNDATKEAYSYLLIDLKPETDEDFRLRSNIFPGETTFVYIPKKNHKV